ncbi:MAG: NAD kinase [Bacteroidales bacterium]|nr:NAD kinase [Bacteroidales bacterium]MCM1147177.1 NAD kinase [Bacteroidales bacterium]MCM1205403.1 NAD kinase [Bacillota bacterium]MCM1509792.1 NAD kinase [Clostridium sp.]
MKKKLSFAIFGNEYQTKKSVAAKTVLSLLAERGATVFMERLFHDFLTEEQGFTVAVDGTFTELDFDVDFVISMGGDGTFLKAANMVGGRNVPIVGINTGRLGYLADIPATEVEQALEIIYSGEFVTESHAVIEAELEIERDGKRHIAVEHALNDIAVLKQDNASMITIGARINGESLVTYMADGLIVSTPTGSTAYSLSNGGPIIMPQTNVMCLTPVAPHSLNIRPIVVPATAEIALEVESRSHKFLIAVDGRSEKLPETTRITVRRAAYDVTIVKRRCHNYVDTLRNKMMWGADSRS